MVALVAAVIYELWHPDPIINLRLFKDRNFAMAAVGVFLRVRRVVRQHGLAAAIAANPDGVHRP